MAYKVIILYRLYMPSYFLGTFTEYPYFLQRKHCFIAYLIFKDKFYYNVKPKLKHSDRLDVFSKLFFQVLP